MTIKESAEQLRDDSRKHYYVVGLKPMMKKVVSNKPRSPLDQPKEEWEHIKEDGGSGRYLLRAPLVFRSMNTPDGVDVLVLHRTEVYATPEQWEAYSTHIEDSEVRVRPVRVEFDDVKFLYDVNEPGRVTRTKAFGLRLVSEDD